MVDLFVDSNLTSQVFLYAFVDQVFLWDLLNSHLVLRRRMHRRQHLTMTPLSQLLPKHQVFQLTLR